MIQVRYFFQWIVDFSATLTPDLSIATIGILLFGFRIFDAVTDPLAGILSDYLNSKGRSRSEFLGYSAVLMSVGLWLSFLPVSGLGTALNFLLIFFAFLLFFSGYTLYCIPYWSLIEEYGRGNPVLKVKLSALLGQGLFLATAIGFILGPILVKAFGYSNGSLFSIVLGLPLMFCPMYCKFDREVASVNAGVPTEALKLKDFIEIFKSRRFNSLLVLLVGSQMSFTVLTSLSPLFVVHVLKKEISYLAFIMGPVIVLAVICFLLVPWLRTKFEERKLVLIFSLILGGLYLLVSPVTGQYGTAGAVAVFSMMGPCLAVILGLESFLINEYAPSSDRVGMAFGAFNFTVKSMNGLALLYSSLVAASLANTGDNTVVLHALTNAGILLVCLGVGSELISKPHKR